MLLNYGPSSKIDIKNRLSTGSKATDDRIAELKAAGLVTDTKEIERPYKIMVELTPLGRTVAEYLVAIEGLTEN